MLLVAATSSPAPAALARDEATVPDRADRAAPAVVKPPLSPLVGVWQRRDAWLWVYEGGTARLRWRTDWCEPDTRTPCDQVDARGLSLGAVAEMSLSNVGDTEPSTLDGQVVAINTPGLLHIGSVSLTRASEDLVVLRQGDRAIALCRPPRDLNFCDASEN